MEVETHNNMVQQPVSMSLFALLIMWTFVQRSTVQACDPYTQYVDDNLCCRMCPPGTSMASFGTCTEPNCKPCSDGEYQDKYTKEPKCTLQPYCDPNKNFKPVVHTSKKSRTPCLCEEGFHCSSTACITCVPHTACPPGQGAALIGTHSSDTECKECEEGTFSDETSWNGTCKKHTVCQTGFQVSQLGTASSDNTCVKLGPPAAVYVVPILILTLVVAAVLLLYKVKPELFKRLKEKCSRNTHQPIQAEPELKAVQIDHSMPEENEDDPCMSAIGVRLTDNGNVLEQEFGKQEQLSRQESQTEPFSSLLP